MNCVIVSVHTLDWSFGCDMELPSNISVRELAVKLLETLKTMSYSLFGSCRSIALFSDNRALNPSLSLDEQWIWDGSDIVIRKEGGSYQC